METPIIPDIMYVVGEPLPSESPTAMAAEPRPMGRKASADPKSALAGSPSTGGSASSISPSGISGAGVREPRFTDTVFVIAVLPCTSGGSAPRGSQCSAAHRVGDRM